MNLMEWEVGIPGKPKVSEPALASIRRVHASEADLAIILILIHSLMTFRRQHGMEVYSN